MLDQKILDDIINECGISEYEKSMVEGLDIYLGRCSDSLLEKGNPPKNDDRKKLLYLMKFLYQNWSKSDRATRAKKQLCFKVLYIVLMTTKRETEWKQLLEQAVTQTGETWEISFGEYPFITEGEKEEILSEVDAILRQDDIDARFSSIRFDKNTPERCFYYDPEGIYNKYYELYQKIRVYSGPANNDVRQLKAFFVAVKEQNITKGFPAILKILPLIFCKSEILRLLSQIPEICKTEPDGGILSENNNTLKYAKRIFIQSCNEEDCEPVPVWADWFFAAGQKAAMATPRDQKLILGFSLPTRAYAVLFFLLGYETWTAEKMMGKQCGNDSYFNFLSKCRQDEALLIRESNRWKRCWFKGVETASDQKFIVVEIPGAERTRHIRYVHGDVIAKLRKAVDPERKVTNNQIGFQMTGLNSLIAYYNKSENEILQFLNMNHFLYVVIGNKSYLKQEIDQEKIYFQSNGKYYETSFQDIIRFKNFMTEFDLSRGAIISNQKNIELHLEVPEAVIYDGSLAYLNHQGEIQSSIEAVFLDRTEPQFSNACAELMTRYYDREDDINMFDRIPATIEMVAFEE